MARLLPCKNCRQPALATRSGILVSAGQMLDRVTSYLCRRCGRLSSITSMEFALLPEMTDDQIAADDCDLPDPRLSARETPSS